VKLQFTKMQGLGNDFVVFNGIERKIAFAPEQIRSIADRRFGIGCDQLLVIEANVGGDADFFYRIFNADGREVEQCGNGVRAIARFALEQALTAKPELNLKSMSGVVAARLEDDGRVTVNMGIPRFEPREIPFDAQRRQATYTLKIGEASRDFSVLSIGNPHAVQRVADVERAPVAEEGPLIEKHPAFPNGINAGFLQTLDRTHARVRVFERGVGETLSCGTGACAAAIAGMQLELLDSAVTMHTRGGNLSIRWEGEEKPVWMSGPANTVFTGEIAIDDEEN